MRPSPHLNPRPSSRRGFSLRFSYVSPPPPTHSYHSSRPTNVATDDIASSFVHFLVKSKAATSVELPSSRFSLPYFYTDFVFSEEQSYWANARWSLSSNLHFCSRRDETHFISFAHTQMLRTQLMLLYLRFSLSHHQPHSLLWGFGSVLSLLCCFMSVLFGSSQGGLVL